MALADFREPKAAVELLQRSLERGRLGHAYLFAGHQQALLESLALALAKTLNCLQPVRRTPGGPAIDCCDRCEVCRRIDQLQHPDIHWARPESKLRVITVDQMRELMREVQLKPFEAEYKVAIIAGADRLNTQAANAFLKTLEEPPPKSVLLLLATEPQRLLETIVSRCLRLNFSGDGAPAPAPAQMEWLSKFGQAAAEEQKSLLSRYRLLATLLKRLGQIREQIETELTARSPLARHSDIEPKLKEAWEEELKAAIEAEYRLQRADLLALAHAWLRDVWIQTFSNGQQLLSFPQLESSGRIARRINPAQAVANVGVLNRMQKLLWSNVQEALAIETGLLQLNL